MKKITFLVLAILFAFTTPLFAQDWVKLMQDPTVNFFEVQKAFNQYEKNYREQYRNKNGAEPEKVPGFKQFKRWEWFMAPRVSATGERFAPDAVWQAMEEYRKGYGQVNAGNWTFMGPSSVGSMPGAGRLNFVRVHPTDPQTIFVGSPSGGLWKSTTGGTSWTTNTDWVAQVIGCTDLAIDPSNPNIMYLATGDGDAGDTYSVGLLKSTDGGNTWNPTGLSFNLAQIRQISKVLIHPTSTNIILVATSYGVYRSTDSGNTFTLKQQGGFKDMEFKPADPQTVYVVGTEFFKSTDNGVTWTKITSGLPAATGVSRMAIAVTPRAAGNIYLIAGLPGPNYGTEGFYKSTTSGSGFTKIGTPNIGTQQWYDLAIAAAPGGTVEEILLGGQTQFLKSTNGGSTWATTGSNTHVDYHDLIYTTATNCFVSSDGGMWSSTTNGGTWTNRSNGLAISQMYGFGQSATNANLHLQGWQDNGTNRYNGSWGPSLGGDGMLCFISWNNDQNMWASQYSGSIFKSTSGGGSGTWTSVKQTSMGTGGWVTPWLEDPKVANTIYAGFSDVWKHTGGGGTTGWTKISTFNLGTTTLTQLAVSPADNKVIWATGGGKLFKTANGGTNWTTITSIAPGSITYIACHNTDPKKAWITYSGFNSKNKVFQTNDQGVTWINLSNSLPNIPINCVTFQNGSNDGVYIGTDAGVYYRDASLSVWQPFSNNLPNVTVTQINIFYPTNKIRISTYGRGMWESDFYVPGSYPPVANFSATGNITCPGAAVKFTDQSSGPPTSWSWSFPGGVPSTSTAQSPTIAYNAPGTYTATLIATNSAGVDTVVYKDIVTVSASPYPAPTTKGDSSCAMPGTVNLTATGSGSGTLKWWDAPGGGNLVNTGTTYSPTLPTTTTFYVGEEFPAGADDIVGVFDYTIGAGAMFTANDIRGLYFDVRSPIILKTVDVYSNSAGLRTIEIVDAFGTLMDTTVNIPASPTSLYTVTLNFKINPGSQYFIKCRGLVDLYRNSDGAIYPYTSSEVDVTGTNAGAPGYYYFFYNWNYTPLTCNTSRTPVTGLIGCTGTDDLLTNGSLNVFPNPNKGTFDLSFNVNTKDDYTIKITNTLGQIVYAEEIKDFSGDYSKKIDISGFGSGVYMMSLTNSKYETLKKVVVY